MAFKDESSSSSSASAVAVAVESAHYAPIVASYNDRIRPLLDVVDRLRTLNVTSEGIQLPTIVVVGDQSSGKSSVLESLAGISLPRGQGICTRVPLVMRLQHHPLPSPELSLEFNGKKVATDEASISAAINAATEEIAGTGKGISNTPLTLVVKKNGVPDLTMVDLPGITRVPVGDQPEDIYEQITDIISHYIEPEESIILNVISAGVDFSTCESVRMSQKVDKSGKRTLAVVTKADKAPEGLHEKVQSDDVSIGLGYVCVRNRIGDESYEQARIEEAKLFETHKLLSKINKSMVGIPVLAQRLVEIQATIISRCLPEIVTRINDKLNAHVRELNALPKTMLSVADAMSVLVQILGSAKDSLKRIMIDAQFEEYPEEHSMHCTARLAEKLDAFANLLRKSESADDFLVQEMKILTESKGIRLPNFLPRSAFMVLLETKINDISSIPVQFVYEAWDYIETVVNNILMKHSENYPQLVPCIRRAATNLVIKMREDSRKRVEEIVEMEKLTDYTCDAMYLSECNMLMAHQPHFLSQVNAKILSWFSTEGFGQVQISHLWNHGSESEIREAFELKMLMTAYWRIVVKRVVDAVALHMMFKVRNLVNKEMEREIVKEVMSPCGGGIERMLEEPRLVAVKREKLGRSIQLLKEAKDVVAQVIDKIAGYGD